MLCSPWLKSVAIRHAARSPLEDNFCLHTNHRGQPAFLLPVCLAQHCLCKTHVYYSCLSSHHVCCLLPVSWMGWQQFSPATWNPALPSTLKQIPLSIRRPSTLMCAHREARARTFLNCQRTHPHTKHSDTGTHAHMPSHAHTRMHASAAGNTCQSTNPLYHGLSLTGIILLSRGKRNESNCLTMTSLLIKNLLRI